MNPPTSLQSVGLPNDSLFQRSLLVLAILLVAAPWFWPILAGPLPAMLPNLFAWACGALLLGLFPWIRGYFVRVFAWGLVLAAVGSSLIALIQYFDYEEIFGLFIAYTPPGYVTANVHQTNMLATLLSAGLWALWYLTRTRQISPVLAVVQAIFVVTAIAATASRTGMLQLIALSVVIIYWSPSKRLDHAKIALVLGTFYILVAQLLPWLLEVLRGITIDRSLMGRFSSDIGCASRSAVWTNVLHLISLKPWLGWGPGELMYAQYITPFEGVRYCQKMSNAHNFFLQVAVTMGIPFAVTCLGLAIAALLKIRPWKIVESEKQLGYGVLMAIAFHSMLEYPIWFGVFQILAIQALALVILDERRTTSSVGFNAIKSKAPVGACFGLITVLSLVFWDYLKVSQLYLPSEWRLAYYKVDTLNRTRDTVLFKAHVLIAQVVTTPATSENAERLLAGALESLRTAPDPRIIKKVIVAASLSGHTELAKMHSHRFQAAWPEEYAQWVKLQKTGGVE